MPTRAARSFEPGATVLTLERLGASDAEENVLGTPAEI